MAEEKDTAVDVPSSIAVKVSVTESSEIPSEMENISRGNSGSKLSFNMKSDYDGDEEQEAQLEAAEAAQNVLDDLSDDEDDENDTNLVVLDPNHPLMERVQAALKAQLTRQSEKLEIELREKQETFKNKRTEREHLGVDLYGLQQQLARQQMMLEKEQDNLGAINQLRKQKEELLQQVRLMYQDKSRTAKERRNQTTELRKNVESQGAKLKYLSDAHQTLKTDITVTKRAADKTDVDMMAAQTEKREQDMYLNWLTERILRLEDDVRLYSAQCVAQAQETKAVKESLAEATMELETIVMEKQKLYQQWTSSLIGMSRRDEAYTSMQTAVNIQRQTVLSLGTEIEGYKKAIQKEQETNEQLTVQLNKAKADIEHVKKQIMISEDKKERLKEEYMNYTRTLQETEQALFAAQTDRAVLANNLDVKRVEIEREANEKRKTEDNLIEKLMYQMTIDKATQYSKKTLHSLRKRTRELETAMTEVDNNLSKQQLEISNITSMISRLKEIINDCNITIDQMNTQISKSESEIIKNNALIERKQTQIDQLNKKIDLHISKLDGGEEFGPLETKIHELQKQISESVEECHKMQQHWLRQQNELVKKTKEADEQSKTVDNLKKQLVIMEQKRLRIDGELEQQQTEEKNVERNISQLRNDMVKLNTLVAKKKSEQETLEQGNLLMEGDFVHALKEAELESIQLQNKVDKLKEEKERLLNGVIEAEHQIKLWERKTQLAKEMRQTVESDVGQAEIQGMKAEIHRMEVRHNQLMRQQEKMIQDMEKAVYRRETIIYREDAQVKSGKADNTKAQLKKKITETKKRIRQVVEDTGNCDHEIQELQLAQQDISEQLKEQHQQNREVANSLQSLEVELEQLDNTKHKNTHDLVSQQNKVKHFNAMKEGKYTMVCRDDQERQQQLQRQQTKLETLVSIVNKLHEDFPHARTALRRVSLSMTSRNATESKPEQLIDVM